ncbi:MAG: ABC transporter permease [Acetobacteraceae bacterium]
MIDTVQTVVRRIVGGVGLILAVIVLNFILIHLAPGGPAQTLAGEMGGATPAIMEQIRHAYGLDRSLPAQLASYVGHVVQGNFGISFYYNQPVLKLILQRLPVTLLLIICAQGAAFIIGTFLGACTAGRRRSILGWIVDLIALIGYALPVFWLGIMLLIGFAYLVPIFPISGMQTIGGPGGLIPRTLDIAHHLVLPAFTLGVVYLAVYSRLTKTNMLETLRTDYVQLARAKGVAESVIRYKHALRNALIPVITITGLQFSRILAGAILTETVFDWPGMGLLTYDAILRRDYPLLLGILIMSAIVVVIVNILTDLACALIDPRLRRANPA